MCQKADFTLLFIYSLVRSNPSGYLLLPTLVSGHHLDTFALSYCWISYRCLASSLYRTSFPFHFFSLIFIDLIYRLQRFSVFSFHLTVEFFLFSIFFLSLVGFDLSLSSFRSRWNRICFFSFFFFFPVLYYWNAIFVQVGIVVALNDVIDGTERGPKPRAVKTGRKLAIPDPLTVVLFLYLF